MATELATGFISLSVKYRDGMRQINDDLNGLQGTADRAGTRAGNALSQSMGRAMTLDRSATTRAFTPVEQAARRSGEGAGQELGESIIQGARREVQRNGGDITDGLGSGAEGAGDAAGAGFMAGMAPALAKLGTKAGPIGLALTAAVGLAAVTGGALAAEVMAGFDRQMANKQLQVKLGLDEASVAGVNEAVNNAYKNNFGQSTEELTLNAEVAIKNQLADANDPAGLQKVIEQLDTVAQVSGYTGEELARSVSVLVKTGVVQDATGGLDLITKAAQSGLDVSGDLMDTLTEYGVQFAKVGIDGQQALGLVKQLMDGGARSTDLAADAIKEFSLRSIDTAESTTDAYTAIGLNADEMRQKLAAGGPAATEAFSTIVRSLNAVTDPVERNAQGVALFGTQWEDLGASINNLDPSKARDAIGQVAGATQEASDTLGSGATAGFESFGRSMELLRGKFQDFLAKAFGPMASEFGGWLTEMAPKVEGFFTNTLLPALSNLGPAFQSFIGEVKEMGSELVPIIQVHGAKFLEFLKSLAPVAKAVGAVLGAAFKVLMEVLPPVIGFLSKVQQAIWAVAGGAIGNLVDSFKTVAGVATSLWTDSIVPAWNGIKDAISTGWNFISGVFDSMRSGFQGVADFIKGVWNGIGNVVKGALDGILNAIRPILHTAGDLLVGVPDIVPGSGTLNTLGQKLQAFRTGGTVTGPGGTDNVLAWLTAGEGVVTKQAMANGGATLVAALNNGWTPPVDMIRSMVGHIPGFAEGLNPGADFLRTQIMQLWPSITTIGGRRSEDGYGEHSSGNAMDIMIPGYGTPQGKALGDAVASFLIANKDAVGLDGMIWRQTSFGYGGSWTGKEMSDRGSDTQNHMDHLHVILGKGRGAGAPAVDVPTSSLSLPSGGSLSPGSASSSSAGGGSGASAKQIQNAQDRITDLESKLSTSELALQEAEAKGDAPESTLKAKRDAVEKNRRELDQAKADLETLKASGTGDSGLDTNNPYLKIMEGIKEILPDFGGLAQIGLDGVKESLLPPGFSDPQQWPMVQSLGGVAQFIGGLIGGIPGLQGLGSIIGGVSSAVTGDASGATSSFMSLLPAPFGDATPVNPGSADIVGANQPHPGSGALPGPANSANAMTPDPAMAGGGGPTHVDQSIHVAEGGQIGTDPARVMESSIRQQRANQMPQLGTRRFI